MFLLPWRSVADVQRNKAQQGFAGIPVTADGKLGSVLVGMVTNRDIDFVEDPEGTPLSAVMTPAAKLVTAPEGVTLSEAHTLLR